MGDWKKLKYKIAFCIYLSLYLLLLNYNPYLRYWAYHFWGAIGTYAMGDRSPILTVLNALICSGLMIGVIYYYTLDKKYLGFVMVVFGMVYTIGFMLFMIEKFVSESLIPDQVNNTVELLTIQPTLMIILLGGHHLNKIQKLTPLEE